MKSSTLFLNRTNQKGPQRKSGYNAHPNLGRPICFCIDVTIHISYHEEESLSHSWKASWGAEKWISLPPNCPWVKAAFTYPGWKPGAPLFQVTAKPATWRVVLTPCLSEGLLYIMQAKLKRKATWESPPPLKTVAEKQLLLVKILVWVKWSTPDLPMLKGVLSLKGQRVAWGSVILSQDKGKVLQAGHHVWKCDSMYCLIHHSDIYPKSNIKRKNSEVLISPATTQVHPEGRCKSTSPQAEEGTEEEYSAKCKRCFFLQQH